MVIYNCELDTPVDIGNATTSDFEFSQIHCETDLIEYQQNSIYPDREFYIDKKITYGESLIVWFILLFFIIKIVKSVYNFFWETR